MVRETFQTTKIELYTIRMVTDFVGSTSQGRNDYLQHAIYSIFLESCDSPLLIFHSKLYLNINYLERPKFSISQAAVFCDATHFTFYLPRVVESDHCLRREPPWLELLTTINILSPRCWFAYHISHCGV